MMQGVVRGNARGGLVQEKHHSAESRAGGFPAKDHSLFYAAGFPRRNCSRDRSRESPRRLWISFHLFKSSHLCLWKDEDGNRAVTGSVTPALPLVQENAGLFTSMPAGTDRLWKCDTRVCTRTAQAIHSQTQAQTAQDTNKMMGAYDSKYVHARCVSMQQDEG
jgi:hypothetical protein